MEDLVLNIDIDAKNLFVEHFLRYQKSRKL